MDSVVENTGTGLKRKSRLAVFEHVRERKKDSKKKRFRPNELESEDSSPSESELVIDDEKEEPAKHKKNHYVRLKEEPLNLHCEWDFCNDSFNSWKLFNTHLVDHACLETETFTCRWRNCNITCISTYLLLQHMSYHGYVSKLKNIGQNVIDRNDWPKCNQKEYYKFPISPEGYTCEWEYCSFSSGMIYEFYSHVEVHIHNNPRVSNESSNEIIKCGWQGCTTKFSTKYKLGEHVRTHTKEKTMACPTCSTLFSTKTKLGDHRRRQLATDLQGYQCSQCLKLFPTERLLRDHMRSHINHYKCTMCDMTCPKPSLLAKHMRFKHINEKPFKCPSCPKAFVTKHNMEAHLKTHSSTKFMKCELCDFECRAKICLVNHYESTHDKAVAVYQCHCCKKKFRRGGNLTKHLMKVHNYHWPSGHSRFRYRKDQDGVHRLQTVRYESLEVTQEMIKSESLPSSNTVKSVNYSLKYDNDGKSNYVLSVSEDGKESFKTTNETDNILITINDVDEFGNIVSTEVVESGDISKTVVDKNEDCSIKKFTEIEAEEAGIAKTEAEAEGITKIEAEGEGIVESAKVRKEKRKKRKKPKKLARRKSKKVDQRDNFRHFSEDVILNYDKFKINTSKST